MPAKKKSPRADMTALVEEQGIRSARQDLEDERQESAAQRWALFNAAMERLQPEDVITHAQRSKRLNIRVTEAEHASITAMVEALGLATISEYLLGCHAAMVEKVSKDKGTPTSD
jgi:hypothetical protein